MVIYRKVSRNVPDIFHPFATLLLTDSHPSLSPGLLSVRWTADQWTCPTPRWKGSCPCSARAASALCRHTLAWLWSSTGGAMSAWRCLAPTLALSKASAVFGKQCNSTRNAYRHVENWVTLREPIVYYECGCPLNTIFFESKVLPFTATLDNNNVYTSIVFASLNILK